MRRAAQILVVAFIDGHFLHTNEIRMATNIYVLTLPRVCTAHHAVRKFMR